MQSICKPDLEVSVEKFATKRNPGGEHLDRHEADRLPVHQEPGDVGPGEGVHPAHPGHPGAHLCPAPVPGVRG